MTDVERLILEAWDKLGPQIMADPQELARRLARRRMAILTRPVRAWCLAVRASDRRITQAHWILYPEHAMDLDHEDHPYEPIEHEVTMDARVLRKYCRPVKTDSWGEEVSDVCKMLGTTSATLLKSRHRGIFTERYIKGLGGKHGRYPVPLIHSWQRLDPSFGHKFQRPDPLWGSLWEFLPDMIPDKFEQTIIRRPFFTRKPSQKGVYAPDDHLYKKDMVFRGWRWLCPSCKKECRIIYYPLQPKTLFDYLGHDPGKTLTFAWRALSKKLLPYDLHQIDPPPPTFACGSCHQIQGFSRIKHDGWNVLVSLLTRGLLFGHEVQKPDWYRPDRKYRNHRKLNAAPPHKRQQVLRRLLNGWTQPQIALDMLISVQAVRHHTREIFKQENVANRHELAKKLGSKNPQPLGPRQLIHQRRQRIQELLLMGLHQHQISKRLGLRHGITLYDIQQIYRQHALPRRAGAKALAAKLGLKPAGKLALDDQILPLLLSGHTISQISDTLNISFGTIWHHCRKIYRQEGVKDGKELIQKLQPSQPTSPPPQSMPSPVSRAHRQ